MCADSKWSPIPRVKWRNLASQHIRALAQIKPHSTPGPGGPTRCACWDLSAVSSIISFSLPLLQWLSLLEILTQAPQMPPRIFPLAPLPGHLFWLFAWRVLSFSTDACIEGSFLIPNERHPHINVMPLEFTSISAHITVSEGIRIIWALLIFCLIPLESKSHEGTFVHRHANSVLGTQLKYLIIWLKWTCTFLHSPRWRNYIMSVLECPPYTCRQLNPRHLTSPQSWA